MSSPAQSSPAQRALAHVGSLAAGAPGAPEGVLQRARVTVNFHPDRLAGRLSVAELLARDGVYRSQFETGISNGGLTAYPGGDRDRWEQRMFAGAYPSGQAAGRPVYGGLNLAGQVDGASPRFGSCHLRLTAEVTARATFSHGDSFTEPAVVATADTFGAIWSALLDEVTRTGKALGLSAAGAEQWVAALAVPRAQAGRALDDYVEAQIHGGVLLGADVEAVVADPSFRGTPTEEILASLAPRLQWHPGFVLAPGEFPDELRGPEPPLLALELARRYGLDRIDAAALGRAAQSVVRTPGAWTAFAEPLQSIKRLWHILVLLGRADT